MTTNSDEAAGKKPAPLRKTIMLEYPVEFAGETLTKVTMRRLKAKDFRAMDDIPEGNAAAIALTALICGVDEAFVDEMDIADYLKIQADVADFFPKALADKFQGAQSD